MCQSACQNNALPTVKDGNGSTAGKWLNKKVCDLNCYRVPGPTIEITHVNEQRYIVDIWSSLWAIHGVVEWNQSH